MLKQVYVDTFRVLCEKGLLKLKLHMLDNLEDYNSRFGSSEVLYAGSFAHFNLAIKNSYRTSSLRHSKGMSEIFNNMGRVMKRVCVDSYEWRSITGNVPQSCYVRVDVQVNHLSGSRYRIMGSEATF